MGMAHSILLFDPRYKSCEYVGNFPERFKWNGCSTLSDSRVIFTPSNKESILIFNPRDDTYEEVGNYEGTFKWSGSVALPNGQVLFVPSKASSILLVSG